MKKIASSTGAAVCLSVLTTFAVFTASADEDRRGRPAEEKYKTVTVAAVNPQQHTLTVRGWTLVRRDIRFVDNCVFSLGDNRRGESQELRPGQQVRIGYREIDGTPVAESVEVVPLRLEGRVISINDENRSLLLRLDSYNRDFTIAENAHVLLRNNKWGKVSDLQPGDRVSVLYENTYIRPVVREIDAIGETYRGTLLMVGPVEKSVTVRSQLMTRTFKLANEVTVSVNGRNNARMDELNSGDRVTLNYDNVDGTPFVNRISVDNDTGDVSRQIVSPER